MFFEFLTKRNEKVLLNINHILFITPTKNGAMLVDSVENYYETLEPYESVVLRLQNLKCEKTQKTQKITF